MIIIPLSFGSLTLHNGTTHFASKTLAPAYKADSKLVLLPNGVWFDPHGIGDAPVTPGKLKTSVSMVLPSEAALSAGVDVLFNYIGERADLTVRKLDGTTKVCSARLEEIDLVHPFNIVSGCKTKLNLTFQCITMFS
jgi:hypothetical protein